MGSPTPDVKAVFDRAAEIDAAADREAYLAAACAGAPAVRREVDDLLGALGRAGSFLDQPAIAPPGATGAPDPNPATGVGAVIAGRYKLLQVVGEGAMGTVFMADQAQPVKRRVAVKVIRTGMDSAGVLARFEAERQALALMDHPNIARVLDAGTTAGGQPFFVMELVKGVPLTQFSDQHKLPVADRLNLFVQVCSAVQHAHQKGVIHRDLKPTNILVESHDGRPVPKVIDFGLAKATTDVPLTDRTLFTAFGTVAGTPLYMAPEQATFNAIDVDTRADIYALGVILYELLTGTTPIKRDTFQAAAFDEMLRVIREDEPPTPSTRLSTSEGRPAIAANRGLRPEQLCGLVKGELDWIVMKCLEKERGRRYDTSAGLAADIGRYLADEPVLAVPPSAGYRLRKVVRKNRGLLTGAALVAVALVAGTAVSTWQAVRATRARADADRQRERAQANIERGLGAVDRMLTRVEGKRQSVVPQVEAERQRVLEEALQIYLEFLKEEGDDPAVRQVTARAYDRTARIYQLLGQAERAEEAYGRALAIQTGLADQFPDRPDYRLDQAASHQGLGALWAGAGRTAPAEAAYRDALALLGPLAAAHPEHSEYPSALGAAHDGLGRLHQTTGRLDEAAEDFGRALALRGRLADQYPASADIHSDLAQSHGHLGALYRVQGLKAKAQASLAAALPILERLVGQHTDIPQYQEELARVHESRGAVSREAGEFSPAQDALESARKLWAQLVKDHPKVLDYQNDLARTHNGLGELYRFAGEHDRAHAALAEALRILEPLRRVYPQELAFAVTFGVTCGEMAALLRDRKPANFAEALDWCDKGVGPLEEVLQRQEQHAEARKVLSNVHMARAETLVRLKRREEAMPDWRRMAELGDRQTHAELRSLRTLGLAQLGKHARAVAEVRELEADGREPVYSVYNNACVFALAIRAIQTDQALTPADRQRLAEQYGSEAVERLTQMKAKGYFRHPGMVDYLKEDTDIDPLRDRADFRALERELEQEARPPAK
jgi:tetratricopeptide (TPR) repeat protein/tRNA A-37 threonylcarbamoyl transferase component Bud32